MPTIGRADIDVHYDGKGLPEEARALGEETGGIAGEEHGKAFDKKAGKAFDETGRKLEAKARKAGGKAGEAGGTEYGKGFSKKLRSASNKDLDAFASRIRKLFDSDSGLDEYGRKLRGVDDELSRMTRTFDEVDRSLDVLHERNKISGEDWLRHRTALREWSVSARAGADAAEDAGAKLKRYLDDLGASGDAADELRRVGREGEITGGKISTLGDKFRTLGTKVRGSVSSFAGGSKVLSAFRRDTEDLEGATDKLGGTVVKRRGVISRFFSGFENVSKGIDKAGKSILTLGGNVEKAGDKAGSARPKIGQLLRSFSQFDPSDNLGQLILLLIAFLPQIAVLASAAAGGLVILGGAITGLGLALGVGVIGFSDLFGNIKKLPASVRPAATAIQGLKNDFGKLRDSVQVHLFDGLADDLSRLEKTAIPALSRGMDSIADALNHVLQSWLDDLNSSDFASTVEQIFSGLAPSIENLGDVVSNVFGIIGELLKATTGDVEDFTGGLADSTGDLLAFLKTPEGHRELRGWIDDSKKVLGELGGVIGQVTDALGDLISDPKNVRDTIQSLRNIGDAAVALAGVGDNLGSVATAAVTLITTFAEMAEAVSTAGNTVATVFEVVATDVAGALNLITTLVFNLIGGPIAALIEGAKGIGNIFGDIFTGQFDKIPGHVKAADAAVRQYTDDMASSVGAFVGNTSSYFDLLDSKSQSAALHIAGNFGYTGDEAKRFAGNVAQLANNTGTSLDKLGSDTNLAELASHMNITEDAAKLMLGSVKGSADGSGDALDGLASDAKGVAKSVNTSLDSISQSVTTLKVGANTNLSALESKMGASGTAAGVLSKAFLDTAGNSKTALSGLANASSWKDIQNSLGATGTIGKSQLADKIVRAANDAKIGIDKLPPSIQALVRNYATIPASKSTKVKAVDEATSKILAIKNLTIADKAFTIRANYVEQHTGSGGNIYTGSAYGGIMAGGKQIAGGKKIAFANGGILSRATLFGNVLAGEDGAEAIVPLTKPINQVDKSVRALAAYARGQRGYGAPSASGPTRSTTIEAGAIVVQEAGNGETTAGAILDRLAASI